MKRFLLFFIATAIIFCTCGMYAKLSKDRADLLVKHLDLMRELKTTTTDRNEALNKKPKKTGIATCATDAHLSFAQLKKIVDAEWGSFFAKHSGFGDTILERERSCANDYCVFYHAQRKEFRIFQDFLKEIYEYFQIIQSLKTFHFLRFWNDIPTTVDANIFIDDNNKKGYWNDSMGDMNKLLLSVNLSLFGSCTVILGAECTFDYFVKSFNIMGIDIKEMFKKTFMNFKFDQKHIDKLIALNDIITTKEGTLFQFFIPKNLVNNCAYLSHAFGVPYGTPVAGADFDSLKNRHTTISKPLDAYKKGQALIKEASLIDTMQARLIFSQDMLLNPLSGIKIYRYTTVSDKAMATYTKQLKEIAHEVFVEWLQKDHACDTIKNTKLECLYRKIQEK